jgi:periplasmic divalent cation tolerance protein
MKDNMDALMLAWTTCDAGEDAKRLAEKAVEQGMAACVQVSGPIMSFYRWKGELESGTEFRVLFKFPESALEPLHAWLKENHSYETPQFYAVKMDHVDEAYMNWVTEKSI